MHAAVFPPGLDSTLIVPVTAGAIVAALLTECLGWDFVGLVVPGYLCSVLLLQPLVAAVVLVEAIATYGVALLLDRGATRAGLTFPVFGRDRFFLILATSVIVRVLVETVLLPALARLVGKTWPWVTSYERELFGIGIVLVPLCANRLWRPGLRAGLFQLVVQVGIVWLAMRGLASFTNFSLQGFGMAYDRLALLFLSSGGVQITLLITAALASAFNRKYGWDYHGILVPALLALVAITPIKLLTTLVETVLILLIAGAVVRSRLMRGMSFEGPRKVVLCLVIGLMLKVGLSYLLAARYPGYRPGDLFGFGYLLPSLLAERVWVKKSAVLVLLPTVQTALLGSAMAAIVCFVLARIAPAVGSEQHAKVDRYATLAQAAVSLLGTFPDAEVSDLDDLVRQYKRDRVAAETSNGYRAFLAPGVPGLLCTRAGAKTIVLGTAADAEVAAVAAERASANLAIGGDRSALAYLAKALGHRVVSAPSDAPSARPSTSLSPARTWALSASAGGAVPLPSRALAAAARRIARQRNDVPALASALAPLGLAVAISSDGRTLLSGPDWPAVVLAPNPNAVVVAPHADEMHTPEAAWFAASALQADLVLPASESTAAIFAFALAECASLPMLSVRGASLPATAASADAIIMGQPEPARPARIAWLAPLDDALEARMRVSRAPALDMADLRAFAPGSGQQVPVALLWLSPQGRRMLGASNADVLATPEVKALASLRGVAAQPGDLAAWLLAAESSPEPTALAAAELLARTQDVAMLASHFGKAKVSLLGDEARGLTALALAEGATRALVIPGDGRHGEVRVHDAASLDRAMLGGARILLPEAR